MGDTSLVASVDCMILLPTTSNQTKSGSVNVLEPEPSDNGDLEVTSWRASEAAIKIESSGNEGSRSEIRSEMRGVKSLKILVGRRKKNMREDLLGSKE